MSKSKKNTTTSNAAETTPENLFRFKISAVNRVMIVNSKRSAKRKLVVMRAGSRWTIPAYCSDIADNAAGEMWKTYEGEMDENTAFVALEFFAAACGITLGTATLDKIAAAKTALENAAAERERKEKAIIAAGEKALKDKAIEHAGKRYTKLVEKYGEKRVA